MRNYNDKIFQVQFRTVERFVIHLTFYRELWECLDKNKLNNKSEFWAYTTDAHGYKAVILWCMVFGNHGNNEQTHWKKLFTADTKNQIEKFRSGLLEYTRLTENEWKSYQKRMVAFRDKNTAHIEYDSREIFPKFDTALDVANFYYKWVKKIIYPDGLDVPPFEKTIQSKKSDFKNSALFK
ncbi:MAG: hypothetical protein HON76_13390 [Candidatus Scalindua sp.]|jgi:hypothetical protein|nr:hypothetical protein [Candidatus Scalindua sp.]MBT5307452.1 hypothetical protein [Candidatus Scalindua sp.]MBT6225771.1 hypothetical protein [Candidatus Scalindua sp.]MBT6563510.1 hypothetical protein [Candidatus Scalindua sp.]MBT7212204.1 hypothetical protein [Candidatus Scalindua sp.]